MDSYIQNLTEGRIDFAGQRAVDDIVRLTLITTTVVSFIVGFICQSLTVTFGLFGVSSTILALVVLPPWPMFNRHPITWLPDLASEKKNL